jgi:hypothetical protein
MADVLRELSGRLFHDSDDLIHTTFFADHKAGKMRHQTSSLYAEHIIRQFTRTRRGHTHWGFFNDQHTTATRKQNDHL